MPEGVIRDREEREDLFPKAVTPRRMRAAAEVSRLASRSTSEAPSSTSAEVSRIGCDEDDSPPRCPPAIDTAVPVGLMGALVGGAVGAGIGAIVGHRLSFTF
jgi:hypothetical protein